MHIGCCVQVLSHGLGATSTCYLRVLLHRIASCPFFVCVGQESIPAWRDGQAGSDLQLAMVLCLEKRFFKYEVWKNGGDAFKCSPQQLHYLGLPCVRMTLVLPCVRMLPGVLLSTF